MPSTDLTASQFLAQLKPAHPRLFLDDAGFESLRQRIASHEMLASWFAWIRDRADVLAAGPVIKDSPKITKMPSRMLMERMQVLALAFRITGNDAYRQHIERELRALIDDPNFIWWRKPGFFVLDSSETATACSIAYDWLYDDLDPQLRSDLEAAVLERSLTAALASYTTSYGNNWPKRNNNWNHVCNGGAIVAALAFGDKQPELAADLINHAAQSLPLAMEEFAPDGAWEEGPMYWRYGTMWTAYMLGALESAFGDRLGLDHFTAFDRTGEYYVRCFGPNDQSFNYSDSGNLLLPAPQLLWLANRFNNPKIAHAERHIVNHLATKAAPPGTAHEHGVQAAPIHPFDVVWWNVKWDDTPQPTWPLDATYGKSEVALMRSSWTDPDALFVGVKGGTGRRAHSHLDAGSFVFDAIGQRWLIDIGGENYSADGYFEMWDGSAYRHFQHYPTRPEGHNTLVINPHIQPQQDIDPIARITRSGFDADHAMAICDLSPVYHRQVSSLIRGVALIDNRSRLLVQDEAHHDRAIDFWSFFHTHADIELLTDERAAMLSLNGKRLHAQLLGDPNATLSIMDAVPMVHSPPDAANQKSRAGVRKLVVRSTVTVNPTIAMLFTPLDVDQQAPSDADRQLTPLAMWH